MRLDVHYRMDDNPNGRDPGARPELNVIPSPDQVDHPEIKASILAFSEARAAETDARRAHAQAELELPAAEFKDEQALADALAAKRKDPGPVHAEKQLALIRDLKRKHGAAKIALARAVDGVREGFDEYGDEWESALEERRDAICDQMSKALDEFSEMFGQLERNYQTRSIGSGRGRGQFRQTTQDIRRPNGTPMSVTEIVDALKKVQEPARPKPVEVEKIDPTVKVLPNGQRIVDRKARIKRWFDQQEEAAAALHTYNLTPEERRAEAAARWEAQEARQLANSRARDDD